MRTTNLWIVWKSSWRKWIWCMRIDKASRTSKQMNREINWKDYCMKAWCRKIIWTNNSTQHKQKRRSCIENCKGSKEKCWMQNKMSNNLVDNCNYFWFNTNQWKLIIRNWITLFLDTKNKPLKTKVSMNRKLWKFNSSIWGVWINSKRKWWTKTGK